MNGKFTRLLFLKTAKSKKRKTCRNIFFFRTIPTTFPTYICICWPRLALAGADWRRLLLSASACSGLPLRLPLPAPAYSCLCRLLPARKTNPDWNVPNTKEMHFPGTKPGRNVPDQTPLGHKKDRKWAQHERNALLRHKTWQKRAHQTPLGHKKDRKCARLTQKPAPGNKTGRKCAQQTPLGHKKDRKCAQHERNALPGHKTRQKRAHQTPLGNKKDQKCAQPAQKVAPGDKTGRKCAHDAKG